MRALVSETEDGARQHATLEGAGPPLLLVSGLGGTTAFWDVVAPHLARHFRVIRFDQRGIGASSRGTAPVTIDLLAADCATVLAAAGAERALVAGHSTGGCIALSLALEAPARVAGLLLGGSWIAPNRYMTELFAARRELLDLSPRLYAAFASFLALPPDALDRDWRAFEKALAAAPESAAARAVVAERIAALLAFDGRARAATLHCPATVLGAEDDLIVPAFLQRQLADALPGAELTLLDRGGHFFPITRPEEFTAAVRALAGRC